MSIDLVDPLAPLDDCIDDLDGLVYTCPECGDPTDFPEINKGRVCLECSLEIEKEKMRDQKRKRVSRRRKGGS